MAQSTSPALALPMTARGNEPGWTLTLDAGRMVFAPMEGPRIDVALPMAEALADQGARYAAGDLAVTLAPVLCRDSMSGMPHPMTATVETSGALLQGCAGAPADLLAGGDWNVLMVGDAPVAEPVKVSIAFDPKVGGVSGSSGCNRFFGGFTLTGEGLSFGEELAGTMMACDDAAMAVERAFLDTLAKVSGFDIDADGALLLKAGGGVVIRAAR